MLNQLYLIFLEPVKSFTATDENGETTADAVNKFVAERQGAVPELQASVEESTDPKIQRSVDEVADEIKKAFPSAKSYSARRAIPGLHHAVRQQDCC